MHVCFLCSEYPPAPHGGIGTFTRTLGRALVRLGHQATAVGVYPIDATVCERDEGVTVLRLPHARVHGAGFVVNGARVRRAIRQLHRDAPITVIEGQENGLAILPRNFVAPKIVRMNGGHQFFAAELGTATDSWRTWVERRSFDRADFVCAVSRYVADRTAALLHLDAASIEVLPNPVDTALFHPMPEVATNDRRIVFVGTVREKKGVRQLVQAMPAILATVPDAELCIVGPDSETESGASYIESVLRPAMPEAVAARVRFAGRVDNTALPALLASAAVCVYPSHMEALPIAFIEGMAMGKAVVASSTGPGPEVIEHGVSGLLCDPHDPRSIAEQVTRALTDRSLRERLGRRAHEEVAARFAIDVLAKRNLDYYERCARHYRDPASRAS